MDFTLPDHLPGVLAEMDAFIEEEIKPLEREHMQYFDQRREYARTDWENGGIPARAWEDLLGEMRKRADKAGWPSSGNIWRTKDSGCTTTCRTNRRSSATSHRSS